MDTGPIIMQAVVPVKQDDSADELAARILKEEHRIYPESIKLIAEDKLVIEGRKVKILKEEN
jgi:phosphoribosylglycinamide formyltransferase-1